VNKMYRLGRIAGMEEAAKIAMGMINWAPADTEQGHIREVPATLVDQAYWDVSAAIRAAKEVKP
jgi:hypothetical protein